MKWLSVFIVALGCSPAFAQFVQLKPSLAKDLAPFEPFLGVWEINDHWADGPTLHAIAEYKAVLGGEAVEIRTWVSDDGGPLYERYRALLRHDNGRFIIHTLSHDGSLTESAYTRDGDSFVTSWESDGTTVTDSISLADDNTMRWLVKTTNADSGDKSAALDGQWERRGDGERGRLLRDWEPAELEGELEILQPLMSSFRSTIEPPPRAGTKAFQRYEEFEPGPGGKSVWSRQVFKKDSEVDEYILLYGHNAGVASNEVRMFSQHMDFSQSGMIEGTWSQKSSSEAAGVLSVDWENEGRRWTLEYSAKTGSPLLLRNRAWINSENRWTRVSPGTELSRLPPSD